MLRLKVTAIQKSDLEPYPLWIQDDLKSKIKYKGAFPETVWKLGDLKLYECPLTWITRETALLMKWLCFEEKPVKVFPGEWIDQPVWYIEAIEILNSERFEHAGNNSH